MLSISGGPAPHSFRRFLGRPDVPGTSEGTGFTAAVRVDFPLSRAVTIEPSAGLYFHWPVDGGQREIFLLDCGVHLGWPSGPVRPFGGVGVGTAEPLDAGVYVSAHAVAGARFDIIGPWSGRAEVRWRSIQFLGSSREYTAGIGLRL